MRLFNPSPIRGISHKWFGILTLLTLSLALTSAPQWGAFAQELQQTQQTPQTQPVPQASTLIPEIKLNPVSLDGPIQRAEKEGTALPVSLRDIIKIALQANLDIAIADTREGSLQQSLLSARSAYAPTMSGSFSWGASKGLNYNAYDAAASTIQSTLSQNWSTTINQSIPTGGSFRFTLSGNRRDTNSGSALANPLYNASYSLSFTQNLLRDFKIDSSRNAIKVANLNLKANDSQFKSSVSTVIQQVESAYWDLVSAIGSYEIAKAAVISARLTVAQNTKKRDIGTMAPIDVVQSLSQQANREVSLLSAEDGIQRAQNSLKTLISKDRSADIWGKTIIPTDQPQLTEFKIDLETAIQTALKNSPTLEQMDYTLQQTDLTYKLNLNQRKWGLSVTGSMSGASSGVPEGNKSYPPKLWGGLGTSYLYMFNTTPPSWSVGMSLSIPLSRMASDAQLATTRISRENQLMQRTKSEQQIIVSVRNALQGLNTARRQIDTADIGVQLAEAQLAAQQKRLEAGLAQNFDVLTAQDNVTSSKKSALDARINYRKAILNLQQAMFTLLDASNINLATDRSKTKVANFK
jgi:outer membrane protein TolC